MTADRLRPRSRRLWLVRWVEVSGRNVRHRYYTRHHDASRFLDTLQDHGRDAELYLTRVEWEAER